MAIWRPELKEEKYKQVILFLLNSAANNPLLGKVKLFKLLYYVDFDHYQAFYASITGDIYHKKPYGPVPQSAERLLLEMKHEGLIDISMRPVGNYQQYVFTPREQSQREIFEWSEIEVLEEVAAKWAHHRTNDIVIATHGEAPWRAVEMGEEIPYSLAFYRKQVLEEETDGDEELEAVRTA